MHSMNLTTPTPNKVIEALEKGKVDFKIGRIVPCGELRGAQAPGVAQRIYRQLENRNLLYEFIADDNDVSRATVIRVGKNPAKYGVKGPPITRLKPRK